MLSINWKKKKNPADHAADVHKLVAKWIMILGIIRRTYMFLNKAIFLPLYKVLVRNHFDYAMSLWNPHMIKFIESIESV